MSNHTAESIIRVAQAGGGSIIVGDQTPTNNVVRIIQSTTAPVIVKAGNRSTDSLMLIAETGGKRVTIDFS